MRKLYFLILLLPVSLLHAQAWPSGIWSSAVNLTSVMDAGGINDLSGLHFNPVNNRLYCVQGDGRVRILLWNTATNTFSQLASKAISGGPEGITQANLYANEFYTIDENNYEIRRYTHTTNFAAVTLYRHWNLLAAPSPMADTGNTGPEGITFVPDSFLSSIGFISQKTGQPYISQKGLGGLFFVAHQDGGYIWVYDVNPNTNDDFAYVGKYVTNRSESCDLSFDRSTGLMYILHNIAGNNRLEVTDLSTAVTNTNERKFVVASEYSIANPADGNENIEGFAMTPKCQGNGIPVAWLCRDVESNEDLVIQQDALRWFGPFAADGTCVPLANDHFEAAALVLYPNPVRDELTVTGIAENAVIQIYNSLGQSMLHQEHQNEAATINVSNLGSGIYFVEVTQATKSEVMKFYKN